MRRIRECQSENLRLFVSTVLDWGGKETGTGISVRLLSAKCRWYDYRITALPYTVYRIPYHDMTRLGDATERKSLLAKSMSRARLGLQRRLLNLCMCICVCGFWRWLLHWQRVGTVQRFNGSTVYSMLLLCWCLSSWRPRIPAPVWESMMAWWHDHDGLMIMINDKW